MRILPTTSLLTCILISILLPVQSLDPPKDNESKSAAKVNCCYCSQLHITVTLQLPPCGACTNLVTSFEAGVERTKRGKLEGGDAAWEEKSGQKYATSEVTSHNTG